MSKYYILLCNLTSVKYRPMKMKAWVKKLLEENRTAVLSYMHTYMYIYPAHQRSGKAEYCFGPVRPCARAIIEKTTNPKLM